MDDRAAIERCRAGDTDAFRHIVERYQSEALGHAAAILGNREDAADAAQEAFVLAFRALDRFRPDRKFYPWLYVILRNCCFKLANRRRRTAGEPLDEFCLLAAPDEGRKEQQTRQLEMALLRLTAEDRELITLKHLDGLSYEELAERLDIPPGTVMSRLYHARKRLRQQLEILLEKEV
jgi:RNA polymerase sigma-70 factor (ECF subfamily)